jgi:hypothetical protein
MVAVIQLAISLGATVGGWCDLKGYQSTFDISAAILCVSAVLAYIRWRAGPLVSAKGRSPSPVRASGRLTPGMHEKHSSSHQVCAHELSSGMGIGLRHM